MLTYHPKTREAIADQLAGIRVETGQVAATVLLDHSPSLAVSLFTVTGCVMVTQLYVEVETVLSADAADLKFCVTFTTPVIAENDMCAASASLSGSVAGVRCVWVGGAVATAAVITDSAGLSDVICVSPHIVGGRGFVGAIKSKCGTATCSSGALRGYCHYVPMTSDGLIVAAV